MSSYSSSQSNQMEQNEEGNPKQPFEYDYFLSKSIDLLVAWNDSVHESQKVQLINKNLAYLKNQFTQIKRIDKFRTVSIIRANAFIQVLKKSFQELLQKFIAQFNHHHHHSHNVQFYSEKLKKVRSLEEQLRELLGYLRVVLDQQQKVFYSDQPNFTLSIFETISNIYTFIISPKLIWDIIGVEAHLLQTASPHQVSLGGNYNYYQNIIRSLTKRNLHLRQIFEKLDADLKKQTNNNWTESIFIVKTISLVWCLGQDTGVDERQKKDFIDCLKGLYFYKIELQKQGIDHHYIIVSLHLEYLQAHRMFKDYSVLEDVFINILEAAKRQQSLMCFVESLQLNLLPFQKRKRTPRIQVLALEILQNYIGIAKNILGEKNVFLDIQPISQQKAFGTTKYLLKSGSVNGLIDLIMRIQEGSKQAFSYGGLQVHRIYLKMIDLLKRIYLSFENQNWIFPADILIYIPLGNLIEVSENIHSQVKKSLFRMVSALSEDQLSRKITINKNGQLQVQRVRRSQHLQVIIQFLQACKAEQQYINLPEVLPRNLQTSILYVKSLEARLQLKQPPQDQKSYIEQNLRYCETQKVNIEFKWFENTELIDDRIIEFNFQKDLAEDWMRKIYRETINKRESLKISHYYQKYKNGKLKLAQMSDMLRYNHGINISESLKDLQQINIKQDDIFELLQEIKIPLEIGFDIFNLTLDQQISLNYAHICLGFYNINYKQAEGNQVYRLIFEKIMKPYLNNPLSSKAKFKSKYPGFFQKWIYSFQICQLFLQLSQYIGQYGSDKAHTQDAVSKIKLLTDFLDNKENIIKSIGLDQLTTTFIQFSTTISDDIQPLVYIAVIDLYCLLLRLFLKDSQEISIQFIVNQGILSNLSFIEQALKYVNQSEQNKKDSDPSILNEMLKQLPTYMNSIGLRRTFKIIETYIDIRKIQIDSNDCNMNSFLEQLLSLDSKQPTFLQFLLQFLVRIRKIASISKIKDEDQKQQDQGQKKIRQQIGKQIMESMKVFQLLKDKNLCSLEGMNMTQLIFLQDLIKQLNNRNSNKQSVSFSRIIIKQLLILVGSKQDLMYFAQKLDMLELILCGGPKQQQLLIALIVQNKHKETQTQLLKKLLRDNRKLSEAADRAIDILCLHPEKIHSYHINRLIQINSRYPKQRIEQFLIANLACERNNSAAKINQKYLATDLSRLLQRIPKKLCSQLLLKGISAVQRDKLIQQVNIIFEKLLYLPIKKFDNINLATVQEADGEDWQSQSEDQTDIKQKQQKEQKKQNVNKNEFKQNSISQQSGMQQQDGEIFNSDDSEQINDYDDNYYRPDYLQIFTLQSRKDELKLYEQIMILRQQIDVLIVGNYKNLKRQLQSLNGKIIYEKIVKIIQRLNRIAYDFAEQIILKMPQQLYNQCRNIGLKLQISQQLKQKMNKQRQPSKKKPHWLNQFFSDRDQSDDSQISENDRNDYDMDEDDDEEEDEQQGQYDSNQQNSYDDDNDDDINDSGCEQIFKKPKNKKKVKKEQFDEQPPELLPTYSKIEQQMSGGQLKREQIIKLLQIALYMLLRLPESQIRCRHILNFYIELLDSSFGQIFLQSFFTIIRFDESDNNLQNYVHTMGYDCGLQQLSIQDAMSNILYLLRQIERGENSSNILFKQSGILLPIAQQIINEFKLPLQNNVITLLLIYISTNKSKIRNKISNLNFNLYGDELGENQKQYKLNNKQLSRIIQHICKYKNNNKIWQIIQQTMNLKIKQSKKLQQCINGYGCSLYKKIVDVSKKIVTAIKQGQGHRVQNSHHIVSKLVFSCKQQIKQFYYINKQNLMQIFNQQGVNPDTCQIKQIPKLLVKYKDKLIKNKELMRLSQAMFYFLKLLKDQFYGKIQDKLFNKLMHYPKMLIQASWYYIYIYSRTSGYVWTTPAQVQYFFEKHTHFGSYKFKDLQQVFNLILYFLNLESFCTNKFKELLIPVLMKNPIAAQQVGLRFKIPKIDEEVDSQNILVTRKCSFDMAFYQVHGEAISVEFHQEEGSDHGGLVRELMIGWKGRGVGEEGFFIGKILGISFKQGVPYGGVLDIGMFVAITNFVPTIQFFQQFDPEIYRSLVYIRDNDPSQLYLRFVIEKLVNGALLEIQLVENGREIQLTRNNKQKYLKIYCEKYFHLGRQQQLKEIQFGFNSVVNSQYAQIFTPQEMMRQIRGQQIIDVKMLISKAKYEGYSQESPVIKWFWSIVQGFNQDLMNTFIQFVTGSPKITIFNGNFNITIQKVYDIKSLPVAHTCFNTLDLPEYSSRQILQKKLLTAICEGNNSFGIL